jgi:hypothetical protein
MYGVRFACPNWILAKRLWKPLLRILELISGTTVQGRLAKARFCKGLQDIDTFFRNMTRRQHNKVLTFPLADVLVAIYHVASIYFQSSTRK